MADANVELQQIGLFPVTRLLGESSTSRFYLGKHPSRKKEVFIRVLSAPFTNEEAKETFLTRAMQLKKFTHRNAVPVLDYGLTHDSATSEEVGYLVMQYVTGETLRQRFSTGQQLAPDEVKRLLTPIADALQYAHTKNILHGNLHPGNLLTGSNKETLITDFSLTLQQPINPFDDVASAIPYMSPEQLRGIITSASDQYALAVIIYELLCGQRPYKTNERATLLYQQENEPLSAPSSLNSNISSNVENVLLMALAYQPEERFPTIHSFADNYLHALMGLPMKVEAHRPSSIPTKQLHNNDNLNGHTPIVTNDGTVGTDVSRPPSSPKPKILHQSDNVGVQFIAPSTPIIPPSSTTIIDTIGIDDIDFQGEINHAPIDPTVTDDIHRKGAINRTPTEGLADIVTADLWQGGILSQRLPGYEERPAQIEMATLVAHSLTDQKHAVIEAGTGTGKSLAYLVPIVRSGKVAIISTANKALQEQLFYKDIPFVQKHIKDFDAALVKGMGNYVCLDRLESERTGMQFYAKNRDFMRLLDITNDPDADFNGDFETLDFSVPGDIRSKVCADSDQCAWSKCGYFGDCYVREMRERAERAQVIVVNHTLLLLDAVMDGYLLPKREVIVLDEAHHLEEEATRSFTVTVNPNSIMTLLAQTMLKQHSTLSLQDDANKAMMHAWERLRLVADPGYKGRANLHSPFEEGLKLATVITDLADSLRKQRPKDLPDRESQLYDKLQKRTQNLASNIRTVFSVDQPNRFVYYVERVNTGARGGVQLEVSAAPLDVTSWLKEQLFDKSDVICTSATLATIGPNTLNPDDKGPNFSYFRRRTGLDLLEPDKVIERILPLSFDFESNALLYLPRDLPAPVYGDGADDYTKAIAREMYRLVKLSRGRAFLLFSSKRMLDQAYELMEPHLDYPLLRQGDMPRKELTRKFREEKGAILFGLKSFWEGVDISGEALSLVVIDKLPFDPPDDPVHEARVAQMKAAGENWFGIYVLPQAVLRLKQGLGRLLRSRDDRGVMAILDTRLHTKSYGRQVLNALPPARRTSNIGDVKRFFAEEKEDEPF
ncbi:MAG: helicase C-terminal domain-containing protein [Ktedonobacteraceae bacterium]